MLVASNETTEKLDKFCSDARNMILSGDYEACRNMICVEMGEFPDAPQPHNILGILLEKIGQHASAMKHFRAALALDAAYRPAGQNLETYGTFYAHGRCAFDESDCTPEPSNCYTINYNDDHICQVVRRRML